MLTVLGVCSDLDDSLMRRKMEGIMVDVDGLDALLVFAGVVWSSPY